MQCEACGGKVSLSTAHRKDGQFLCPDCHADGQQEQRQRQAREQTVSSSQQRSPSRQQGSSGQGARHQASEQAREESEVAGSPTKRPKNQRARSNGLANGSEQNAATGPQGAQKFNTLRRLGKFISGCGWLVVVGSAIGVLVSLAVFGDAVDGSYGPNPFEIATAMGFFVGSLVTAGLGLLMAAAGQQISCFLAIERNTRSTYELIQTQQQEA